MQLPAAERFFKVNKWAEKLSFCLLTSSQFCHPSYILRSIACCLSSAQSVMLRWPDLKVFDLICINEFSRKFFYVSMYELSWRSWREGGECGIHYFSTENSTTESKVASGSLSSCPYMGSQHSQQLFPSYRCLESKGDQWKNPQNPSDFLTISLPNLGWLTKNNYHFQGSLLLSGYLQNLVLKIVHK